MAKIKVGMLVEIIEDRFNPDWVGHIGVVLRPCSVHRGSWDIEGGGERCGRSPSVIP